MIFRKKKSPPKWDEETEREYLKGFYQRMACWGRSEKSREELERLLDEASQENLRLTSELCHLKQRCKCCDKQCCKG